jgi:hypothetical protein
MASLILRTSVSLDGYVAPADGSSGWEAVGRSPDGAEWVLDTVGNAGAHLAGAVSYARWAGLWPGASGPFAAPMNEIPKVVFSKSLTSADWGETTTATGDLVDSGELAVAAAARGWRQLGARVRRRCPAADAGSEGPTMEPRV